MTLNHNLAAPTRESWATYTWHVCRISPLHRHEDLPWIEPTTIGGAARNFPVGTADELSLR